MLACVEEVKKGLSFGGLCKLSREANVLNNYSQGEAVMGTRVGLDFCPLKCQESLIPLKTK